MNFIRCEGLRGKLEYNPRGLNRFILREVTPFSNALFMAKETDKFFFLSLTKTCLDYEHRHKVMLVCFSAAGHLYSLGKPALRAPVRSRRWRLYRFLSGNRFLARHLITPGVLRCPHSGDVGLLIKIPSFFWSNINISQCLIPRVKQSRLN